MAKKSNERTARGRSQDRKRVAGGRDHEVRYEAKKTGRSKGLKKARYIRRCIAGPPHVAGLLTDLPGAVYARWRSAG
jgi:hypothetical protein